MINRLSWKKCVYGLVHCADGGGELNFRKRSTKTLSQTEKLKSCMIIACEHRILQKSGFGYLIASRSPRGQAFRVRALAKRSNKQQRTPKQMKTNNNEDDDDNNSRNNDTCAWTPNIFFFNDVSIEKLHCYRVTRASHPLQCHDSWKSGISRLSRYQGLGT